MDLKARLLEFGADLRLPSKFVARTYKPLLSSDYMDVLDISIWPATIHYEPLVVPSIGLPADGCAGNVRFDSFGTVVELLAGASFPLAAVGRPACLLRGPVALPDQEF